MRRKAKQRICYVLLLLCFGLVACESQQGPASVDTTPGVSQGGTPSEENKVGNVSPFSTYHQENVAIADGVLYYCDSQNDGALTAYNLATAETKAITKEQGGICKTASGVYFVTKVGAYQVQDGQLGDAYVLPENAAFVDVDENYVYYMTEWKSKGVTADFGDCKKIYRGKEGTEPELVYEVTASDDCLRSALLLDGKLYLSQKSGVYVVELATGETKQVYKQSVNHLRTDGEEVYFQQSSGVTYALYEITQDTEARWLGSTKNPGICITDGEVYSVEDDGLVVKELTAADGEGETYGAVTHNGTTASMDCDGEYVAFRRADYPYDMHLFNLRTGEYLSIDSSQE